MFTATVMGNLTADPVNNMIGNSSCCNFTIAASTAKRGEDGKNVTQFIRCAVWGKQGDSCSQFLKKGDAIVAEGNMYIDDYVGSDGATHTSINLNTFTVQYANIRHGANSAANTNKDEDPFAN